MAPLKGTTSNNNVSKNRDKHKRNKSRKQPVFSTSNNEGDGKRLRRSKRNKQKNNKDVKKGGDESKKQQFQNPLGRMITSSDIYLRGGGENKSAVRRMELNADGLFCIFTFYVNSVIPKLHANFRKLTNFLHRIMRKK